MTENRRCLACEAKRFFQLGTHLEMDGTLDESARYIREMFQTCVVKCGDGREVIDLDRLIGLLGVCLASMHRRLMKIEEGAAKE
jgi:hypothetical protein